MCLLLYLNQWNRQISSIIIGYKYKIYDTFSNDDEAQVFYQENQNILQASLY
ncbi:unnamed protein product [Paramecium pentaurelia]|uniref:Uncharacterized protein n=1 Tax=Paramecium pentaurelia TaxID=43138 RepID=A0A8S1T6D1_9CILI|nr:unnamed protein product [Paramecium pentaurelia]